MKVAWVTHRDYKGGEGGAEANEYYMMSKAPQNTEITVVKPGGVGEDLSDFDHVVVTGIFGFSPRELNELGRHNPIWWPQDIQFASHWFYDLAKVVIFQNEMHRQYEIEKNPQMGYKSFGINPGYIPDWETLKDEHAGRDFKKAMWAHRPVAHKGLDLAAVWAKDNKMRLDVYVNRDRDFVLAEMQLHSHFVLLSHIFDAGPHAIIEAQLSGCEIVVNDQVGVWENLDVLKSTLDVAPELFWNLVMST